jgi:hypothetical protein
MLGEQVQCVRNKLERHKQNDFNITFKNNKDIKTTKVQE